MIYFYSDTHFDHSLMLRTRTKEDGSNFKDLNDYNEYIISNFNNRVTDSDTTYFLGDFCMNNSTNKFLDRLNGSFYFIKGNHDKNKIEHKKVLRFYSGYLDKKFGDQKITLCHFPMRTWECSHFGAFHLHGHHHSKTDFGGKTLNVSIDNIGYTPISLDRVVTYMSSREDNWDLVVR